MDQEGRGCHCGLSRPTEASQAKVSLSYGEAQGVGVALSAGRPTLASDGTHSTPPTSHLSSDLPLVILKAPPKHYTVSSLSLSSRPPERTFKTTCSFLLKVASSSQGPRDGGPGRH